MQVSWWVLNQDKYIRALTERSDKRSQRGGAVENAEGFDPTDPLLAPISLPPGQAMQGAQLPAHQDDTTTPTMVCGGGGCREGFDPTDPLRATPCQPSG